MFGRSDAVSEFDSEFDSLAWSARTARALPHAAAHMPAAYACTRGPSCGPAPENGRNAGLWLVGGAGHPYSSLTLFSGVKAFNKVF